jgi:Ca-activated chloride channel family protein
MQDPAAGIDRSGDNEADEEGAMAATRTRAVPLVTAVVVGALLIAGVHWVSTRDASGAGAGAAVTMPATPRPGCTTLTVAASSEKAALMATIAGTYNSTGPSVDGQCIGVRVVSKASGDAEAALARGWDESLDGPRPDVWSPAASTWVGLLREDLIKADRPDITPATSPSVTSTPLVLAMPQPMAEALGWPKAAIGWSDLLRLAQDPHGWAAKGHPEWGRFTLGKTNPNLSTSGLAATVGAFVAATGRSSDLTERDLADPAITAFVAGVESSVVHYGDTTLTYLSNLQAADDAGRALSYVSAVAVEEKSVLDYDAGNPTGNPATLGQHAPPRVPLVAVYPKEGTLESDSPYVVLTEPWVDSVRRDAAAAFLTYLRSGDAQQRFAQAGFRAYDGSATDVTKASSMLLADQPKLVLTAPAPAVLAGVRAKWEQVRKRARVLLLLDVSGSMDEPVPGASGTRLDLAKAAARSAVASFAPDDEVGLWIFTTDLPEPGEVYQQLVPVEPVAKGRAALERSLDSLSAQQGTPLYSAIRKAYADMTQAADPSRINAVVVLTDGHNEYPEDTDLDGLVRDLTNGSTESPVRIFSIAYGSDSDLAALQRISEATRAVAYDATNAATINTIFTTVISNF